MSIGSIFMKSIPQGAATTVRCVSLSNDQIVPGHYYKDCNEANDALRKDIKPYQKEETKEEEEQEEHKTESQEIQVNSSEYKLWEWSELLIVQKGFKLDMEGFEEEEKERELQEEKEEAADKEEEEKKEYKQNDESEPKDEEAPMEVAANEANEAEAAKEEKPNSDANIDADAQE